MADDNTDTITRHLAKYWMGHLRECEDIFAHLSFVDRSAKRLAIDALVSEFETFDAMLAKEVPCGWRIKEYRRRTIITLIGEVTFVRRIYTEPSGITHAYLDEVLGIRPFSRIAPDACLFIARTAAEVSYRKTARAFQKRSGVAISAWTVMSIVHGQGRLIARSATETSTAKGFSQDSLFVEFDGIYVAHQSRLRKEAPKMPTKVEVKGGVAYAGKDHKGRRGKPVFYPCVGGATAFWRGFGARIGKTYEVDDVCEIYAASDAAGWCKNHLLEEAFPHAKVYHQLDPYHLNREICKAFEMPRHASHFIALVYARRYKRLFEDLCRITEGASGEALKRYRKLASYLENNKALLMCERKPSAGSMEGTNAHVWAARMKVWGGAWSAGGASAMAHIRAHLASGEELIVPSPSSWRSDKERKARQRYEMQQVDTHVALSSGADYEPPQGHIVLTTHMHPRMYGLLQN